MRGKKKKAGDGWRGVSKEGGERREKKKGRRERKGGRRGEGNNLK